MPTPADARGDCPKRTLEDEWEIGAFAFLLFCYVNSCKSFFWDGWQKLDRGRGEWEGGGVISSQREGKIWTHLVIHCSDVFPFFFCFDVQMSQRLDFNWFLFFFLFFLLGWFLFIALFLYSYIIIIFLIWDGIKELRKIRKLFANKRFLRSAESPYICAYLHSHNLYVHTKYCISKC